MPVYIFIDVWFVYLLVINQILNRFNSLDQVAWGKVCKVQKSNVKDLIGSQSWSQDLICGHETRSGGSENIYKIKLAFKIMVYNMCYKQIKPGLQKSNWMAVR